MLRLVSIVCMLLLLSVSFVFAEANTEISTLNTTNTKADVNEDVLISQILLAEADLETLQTQEVPSIRYADLLSETKQLYEAQTALANSGGNADFTIIEERFISLQEVYTLAFKTHDELEALQTAIDASPTLMEDDAFAAHVRIALEEYETERFELSLEEIDKAYVRMSEVEAIETKIKASYAATSRNIKDFLYSIRYYILAGFGALVLMFLLGRKQFLIFRVKKQIKQIEFKKHVIQDLIATAQREYFEDNKINESTYHIRTKKYAEIIRDVNREKPILEERLALLRGRTKRSEENTSESVKTKRKGDA